MKVNWIELEDKEPEILQGYWRCTKLVLAQTSTGRIEVCIYGRVNPRNTKNWSNKYSPKFICVDQHSNCYEKQVTNVKRWIYT